MAGHDAALTATVQDRMSGNDGTIFEDANLSGRAVHFNCPPPRAVRHAVEIAVDRDHAITRDAPLEPQHSLERPGGQRLKRWALLGKMRGHNPLRRGMVRALATWSSH